MKDKKLQLALLIGATVLVVVIIMICVFTGSLDVGGSSVPAPENRRNAEVGRVDRARHDRRRNKMVWT